MFEYLEDLPMEERISKINEIKKELHKYSPFKHEPVDCVVWEKAENVIANDYNPNSVAPPEMLLLHESILQDGYTQPIVTIFDPEQKMYVIVDGFHRFYTAKTNEDILSRNRGYIPIVVIEKDINDRMASTVRHNRARGMHSVSGMSSMVFQMLENGWQDEDICNEIGVDIQELIKLKHITGFSKLFSDAEYNKAWETTNQIRLKLKHQKEQEDNGQR